MWRITGDIAALDVDPRTFDRFARVYQSCDVPSTCGRLLSRAAASLRRLRNA